MLSRVKYLFGALFFIFGLLFLVFAVVGTLRPELEEYTNLKIFLFSATHGVIGGGLLASSLIDLQREKRMIEKHFHRMLENNNGLFSAKQFAKVASMGLEDARLYLLKKTETHSCVVNNKKNGNAVFIFLRSTTMN